MASKIPLKSKKGVSGVVTAVIMIALVMGAITIVWNVINNILSEKLEETESCFGNFGAVEINNRYTCYNTTSGEFQFSINVKDVEVDGVLVSISGAGSTQSFEIRKEVSQIDYLSTYPSKSPDVKAPGKNSGKTYVVSADAGFEKPDMLSIAPIIGGKQCEVVDTLSDIDSCSLLA